MVRVPLWSIDITTWDKIVLGDEESSSSSRPGNLLNPWMPGEDSTDTDVSRKVSHLITESQLDLLIKINPTTSRDRSLDRPSAKNSC